MRAIIVVVLLLIYITLCGYVSDYTISKNDYSVWLAIGGIAAILLLTYGFIYAVYKLLTTKQNKKPEEQ